MDIHAPKYYVNFQCLAGSCPHTCCAGWEIPIDSDTAALYRSLPGPLGTQIREALDTDGNGESAFRLQGGRCPFLGSAGLCRIHRQLGAEATSHICQTHPRFSYEYGPLREIGLCGSCPQAANLILGSDLLLSSRREDSPAGDIPALLSPLLLARDTALRLLSTEGTALTQQLQAVLLFANEVQVCLDEDRPEYLSQLCQAYQEGFPLIESGALPNREEALTRCLEVLAELDILRSQWRNLLESGKKALGRYLPDCRQGERATGYFLYRHWLRGVWDGDVLSWAQFAVLGTVTACLLAPLQKEGFPGSFRMFCEELEHNESNMQAIQDAFWDRLSLADLLAAADI